MAPGPLPPEGGGDSLLVAIAASAGGDAAPAPPVPVPPPPAGIGEEGLLRVNEADEEALTALPGIGPALAHRIRLERERSGPFRSCDDLTRVHGIGPRTAGRLEGLLSFHVPSARAGAGTSADCTAVVRTATPDSGPRPGSPLQP